MKDVSHHGQWPDIARKSQDKDKDKDKDIYHKQRMHHLMASDQILCGEVYSRDEISIRLRIIIQ